MDDLWNFWNSLSQGTRGIIIGVISGVLATAIAGAFKLSGKSIGRGLKRLLLKALGANQTSQPPPQQLVIKLETPQPLPLPQEPEPPRLLEPQPERIVAPALPRPPLTGFVGRRDREGRDIVERLQEELAPERTRLIALVGDGGVGKTTLAAETVRALIESFENRIAWISADGRPEFTLATLLDEIATRLGNADLRRLAPEPKKEEVSALVCSARPLIILDNFETISTAEQTSCAEWIANHAACPALITTRQSVNGARSIHVYAMSPDEAREYVRRLIEQSGNPHAFDGLDRDRLIGECDANPLVMQWVAAQIDHAQRPGDVLDDLKRGEGDAAERVFDRSFNPEQVGDDGRSALLALSLFVPSAAREALAEAAGFGEDVRRLNEAMRMLSDLRLVKTTDGNERLLIEGLTRELTKSRLRGDDRAEEFRGRFVAHFLSYGRAHSKTAAEDFDALESERENLLSAMDLAFEMSDGESVMGMMDAIGIPASGFLSLRGYWDEAVRYGEQALEAARKLGDEESLARFTHNLAMTYQKRGEMEEARRLYEESMEIKKKLGNQRGIASTLHQLGMIAQDQGEMEEAKRLYEESMEIKKKLGNQRGIAITLHQLGLLAEDEGDYAKAAGLFREALSIFERLRSPNAEIARQSLARVEGKS
ncbi:MAG: tetratricopeptide repeat protein [Blastocatellia bacterium]|nr:tetratricopeptide repeat protein [Blastocatellia bacterium]